MNLRSIKALYCWWFGCSPYLEAMRQDWAIIPCIRCGAPDTSYEDRCGLTRHAIMIGRLQWLRWRLFESWREQPCSCCGARGKCKPDCDGIPF